MAEVFKCTTFEQLRCVCCIIFYDDVALWPSMSAIHITCSTTSCCKPIHTLTHVISERFIISWSDSHTAHKYTYIGQWSFVCLSATCYTHYGRPFNYNHTGNCLHLAWIWRGIRWWICGQWWWQTNGILTDGLARIYYMNALAKWICIRFSIAWRQSPIIVFKQQ